MSDFVWPGNAEPPPPFIIREVTFAGASNPAPDSALRITVPFFFFSSSHLLHFLWI
ncbi:MAG: hypothetical protein ABIN36_09715 [Ferruginibacter sp.]